MKAKIKLYLVDDDYSRALRMEMKLEGEWFYWHDTTVVSNYLWTKTGHRAKTKDEFYSDVIAFLQNEENIKKEGEELVRKIFKDSLEEAQKDSKEKEIKKLLAKYKKPIEIEVKVEL